MFDGIHGARIARNNDNLTALRNKKTSDISGIVFELVSRLAAVGDMFLVGIKHKPFMRHVSAQFAKHRKSADTGVKNADRIGDF